MGHLQTDGLSSDFLNRLADTSSAFDRPALQADNATGLLSPLFCQLFDGDVSAAHRVAQAWELLRDAANILDNIEDGDSPWIEPETPLALNAATALLFHANGTLAQLVACGVSAETVNDLIRQFNHVGLTTCSGQHLDLSLQEDVTLQAAWDIVQLKTAAAGGLACWAGSRLATADEHALALSTAFGRTLGLLEQTQDDFFDVWGGNNDIKQQKWHALPIAFALSKLVGAARETLRENIVHAADDISAERAARKMIVESGAAVYLYAQSTQLYETAVQLLETLPQKPTVQAKLRAILKKKRITLPNKP